MNSWDRSLRRFVSHRSLCGWRRYAPVAEESSGIASFRRPPRSLAGRSGLLPLRPRSLPSQRSANGKPRRIDSSIADNFDKAVLSMAFVQPDNRQVISNVLHRSPGQKENQPLDSARRVKPCSLETSGRVFRSIQVMERDTGEFEFKWRSRTSGSDDSVQHTPLLGLPIFSVPGVFLT